MKRKALLFAFLLLTAGAHSAVLTVSNTIANPGQYSDFPAAIAAAQPYDTIYVHGSPNLYNVATISIPLTIIGTGHHPQKQNAFVSKLNTLNIRSGSVVLDGLNIAGIDGNFVNMDSVILRNCEFEYSVNIGYSNVISNWLFENNIFRGGNGPYAINFYGVNTGVSNIIIRNNIIYNKINGPTVNILIDHNFFYATAGGDAFIAMSNTTITNNIFYVMSPQGTTTSIFNNNITFNTSNNTLPYGSNTGSGNINADPKFMNFPLAGQNFVITDDYHLQGTSPGKNSATDGSDVGLWGAAGFSMTGEPAIPVVRLMDINNPNVPVGGNLNVHLKSSKDIK